MRYTIPMLALLNALSLAGMTRADEPAQKPGKLDTQLHVTLDYLLYLPADYETKKDWPLVVFLHGAGERGDDLNLVKKHGPPKLIEQGKAFPFIVVSPQCAKNNWWHWQLRELSALIDDVVAKYKVDKDRIYLTGISMGGFGTWALASYDPDRFAAIVPICGGGELLAAARLRQMPIWAFHGAKDPIVPLRRSEELINALQKNNPQAKLTVYPDAMHDSWTATYDNPDVYAWLLEHKRTPATSTP
jgi:predicted peptidase